MRRSERLKIEAKLQEWDRVMRSVKRWWRSSWPKVWWEIKNFMETVMEFLWFPKGIKTNGDRAWHLFKWWIAVLIGLRVLGFI